MAATSTYLANALLAHSMGKTAYTMPTASMALFRASAGQSPRSTAVTAGQTTVPASPNGLMYRCTTAGTTGATEPTWGTSSGGTTTDGTATWTEMTPDFRGNVNLTEANYTGYARSATTGASWNTPAAGAITNASAIGFPQDTAGTNVIIAAATFDAATGGNLLMYEIAAASTGVLSVSPNVTPSFAATVFSASLA